MSWNNRLYFYAKKKDAVYLGGMDGRKNLWTGIDGVVLLEHKGQPVLVRCQKYSTRNNYEQQVQVQLNCTLERPYFLRIETKNSLSKGINTVLGQLDKGVKLLSKEVDLYRDYGFPEVTMGRSIKTDDEEFTQMVLRDLELRTTLLKNPTYGLRVEPNVPKWVDGGSHCITAYCRVADGLSSSAGWDEEDFDDDWGTPEQHLKRMDSEKFTQKLDALVELAKAAYGALLTWRMPVKND